MVSPVSHKIALPLMAASLLAFYGWTTDTKALQAEPVDLFDDQDGDFLPDSLEWVVMTDPTNADSDGDGVSDYIEVVQGGYPRVADAVALPADDELRVLATTRVDENGDSMLWVHLMFRLMGGARTEFDNVTPWVDLGGTRHPMPDLFSGVPLFWRFLEDDNDGTLAVISAPVAAEETGRNLLPFTFGISARLGGRMVNSSAYYLDSGGRTSVLAAWDADRSAMQSLSQQRQEGPFEYVNRVCVMSLLVVGTSNNGLVVRVTSARCETAHGLRCSSACPMAAESVFVLPDGMGTIVGR